MKRLEVRYCSRPRDGGPSVVRMAGVDAQGSYWQLTEGEVIEQIEARQAVFWTSFGDASTAVIIGARDGRKFLRTMADHGASQTLHGLKECPFLALRGSRPT